MVLEKAHCLPLEDAAIINREYEVARNQLRIILLLLPPSAMSKKTTGLAIAFPWPSVMLGEDWRIKLGEIISRYLILPA